MASVDLERYAGTWYEVAMLPNSFQRMCASDTQAHYRLDGERVRVTNRCRRADGVLEEAEGVARVVAGSNNAKLEVSFFRPFYGDYWIVALDPDYRHVLVGAPDRKFAWLLSRTPMLDDAVINRYLATAQAQGFDSKAFRKTPADKPIAPLTP